MTRIAHRLTKLEKATVSKTDIPLVVHVIFGREENASEAGPRARAIAILLETGISKLKRVLGETKEQFETRAEPFVEKFRLIRKLPDDEKQLAKQALSAEIEAENANAV